MSSIEQIMEIKKKKKDQLITRVAVKISDIKVSVKMSTADILAGSREVFIALLDEIEKRRLFEIKIIQDGENDDNNKRPVVNVFIPGREKLSYENVKKEDVKEIIDEIAKFLK